MAADNNSNFGWEKRWVGRLEGTHYSADGSSPLLRDDNTSQLATHAVIGKPVREEEEKGSAATRRTSSDVVAEVVGAAIGTAIALVLPHAIESAANGIAARLEARKRQRSNVGDPSETASRELAQLPREEARTFAREVDAVLDDDQTTMSTSRGRAATPRCDGRCRVHSRPTSNPLVGTDRRR